MRTICERAWSPAWWVGVGFELSAPTWDRTRHAIGNGFTVRPYHQVHPTRGANRRIRTCYLAIFNRALIHMSLEGLANPQGFEKVA